MTIFRVTLRSWSYTNQLFLNTFTPVLIKGDLQVSQSKSDDHWMQDALDGSCEKFEMTREELRDMKMLRRKDFNEFTEVYCDYIQLEKKEGSLNYTLKELCAKKISNIDF